MIAVIPDYVNPVKERGYKIAPLAVVVDAAFIVMITIVVKNGCPPMGESYALFVITD
jgi:hypothetical protein